MEVTLLKPYFKGGGNHNYSLEIIQSLLDRIKGKRREHLEVFVLAVDVVEADGDVSACESFQGGHGPASGEAGQVPDLRGSLSLHGELEGHGGAHGLPQHVQLCGLDVLLVGSLAGHQRVVGELRVHPSVDTRPREVKSSMLSRRFKEQPGKE